MKHQQKNKRALVTGGAGFIGSHLVNELIEQGWEVVVLDNLATGSRENLADHVRLVVADLSDGEALRRAMAGCSCVFHLAAVSSVQDSLERPIGVHETNSTATLKLLECAVQEKVIRFVFSSSAAVYGDTGGLPAREDMKPNPLSHYAVQKLNCEHYCSVYNRLHGLETVALRYFNVFGPRQRADSPYSGAMARFLDAIKCGRNITIFGSGEQTRDFCSVANVVAANVSAATADGPAVSGKVFNIGSGSSISIIRLANELQRLCNHSGDIEHLDGRSGEIVHSQADISNAFQCLGYSPISFEEGLERFLSISELK